MKSAQKTLFQNIKTEGALISADFLARISGGDKDIPALKPTDYHLLEGEKLSEAIGRVWNRMLTVWMNFQIRRSNLSEHDQGTTLTREGLLLPLFQELGYGRIPASRPIEIGNQTYSISHLWGKLPLHLVSFRFELDKRTAGATGAAKSSPHSLMQDFLNRSEDHLWGIVSNGLKLRLLRDNASVSRQAYIEFDLETLFEEKAYSDFILLYMLCHQSRVEGEDPNKFILESWAQKGQEFGKRALDTLRNGVEQAINELGTGFIQHPENTALRDKLKKGTLDKREYYRQVLRMVYRLLFLFVAEDRDVLLDPKAPQEAKELYDLYYSTKRLRTLAQRIRGTRHADLFEGFKLLLGKLSDPAGAPELALKPLGSFLFGDTSTPDLNTAKISNQMFLGAIRSISVTQDQGVLKAVDYKNLGSEEFGSVYESLLELVPEVNLDAGYFKLTTLAGNERKTTGSYYTPTSLIEVVLDEALNPKLDECQTVEALLNLKVVDPAAGSGHFLIAAAHRIARRVAQKRTGETEPAPEVTREALWDVVRNCIYAVDYNEMAVELCKVALWMEAMEPGKPLSFLDHHIKHGNSLMGTRPDLMWVKEKVVNKKAAVRDREHEETILAVPEGAFVALTGDDRTRVSALKKQNNQERQDAVRAVQGQMGLFSSNELDFKALERAFQDLNRKGNDSMEQVLEQASQYDRLTHDTLYQKMHLLADAWCAAFTIPKTGKEPAITTATLNQMLSTDEPDIFLGATIDAVQQERDQYSFFHWFLEFPEVQAQGGFDVVLGNPPWEKVKLEEKQFFASRDDSIANALNAAERGRRIQALNDQQLAQKHGYTYEPVLYNAYLQALHEAEAFSGFLRNSGVYPLTGGGDVNTYQVFSELARTAMGKRGNVGIIVPTGIATDDGNKEFFADLVGTGQLAALLDFENREGLFPGVHRSYKFSVLVLTAKASTKPAKLTFFAGNTNQLKDQQRVFSLTPQEFKLLNPNTLTCPVFRTKQDAELTKKIYRNSKVLMQDDGDLNPWQNKFLRHLDMSNDSGLFKTQPDADDVPLYEAKLFWHFDHRFSTYDGAVTRDVLPAEHADPTYRVSPRYWVERQEVLNRLVQTDKNGAITWQWKRKWYVAFRDITNATNERTAIFSFLPQHGVGHTAPLMLPEVSAALLPALVGNANSLVLDYIARQKVGGTHLTYGYLKQFPFKTPYQYSLPDLEFITPRVLELSYTNWELAPLAQDVMAEAPAEVQEAILAQHQENGGHPDTPPEWATDPYPFPPFKWNEDRRALLRAELDAYYAKLYGLERDELEYILDPQSVMGEDFPGETFRVLKEKEIRQLGEYRTMRLVLEAWDRLEA
ncbi:Eco57I restriction-modification methylase domain-containing protein [Deinococcus roseus]|uniref:site-specific DNA-methyltransferase (adenine-specific) n=1 Tax=Deinococcus roseus TaxID=392414 RepID=A0ABQ2CV24_9DEIO|nr:N-6 DNA methylase [Deinococcus roseus]GGJ23515.1 hypothetical protein GCM10008938_07080 [Deinococcus roseus]